MKFLSPVFTLSETEIVAANKWLKRHDKKCGYLNKETGEIETGSIGGGITYSFTPTSIGVGVSISCSCGKEPKSNITDYGSW